MILIKILAVVISGTVLSKTYLDFKRKQETLAMFLFWSLTWIGVLIFGVWPELSFKLENFFGDFGLGVGTFLGLIFIFLFFITYRVYVKAHRLERQMRDLVMKIGLKDIND